MRTYNFAIFTFLLSFLAGSAGAAPTKFWELESHNSFSAGKSQGALILSGGGLAPGLRATKIETREKLPGLFTTVLRLKNGKTVIGGADEASLWMLEGDRLRKLCTLPDALMVTRVVELSGGDLLAATLPKGRIHRVKPDGKTEPFVQLPEDHIWNLQVAGAVVFASTGPKAAIYRIDLNSRKFTKWWSAEEKHILAMLYVPKRGLIVGTTPEARVYELSDVPEKPATRLLYDFSGNEIRDIALYKDTLFVAVNQLQYRANTGNPTQELNPQGNTGAGRDKAPVTALQRKDLPQLQVVSGSGTLYALGSRGEVEKVLDIASGYFTQLSAENQNVYASDGNSGRIYRISADTYSAAIVLEVEERQALGFFLKDEKEGVVVAGDSAAAYVLSRDRGKDVVYTSPALDASVPSSFGLLQVYASDDAVKIETRSGTTEEPDDNLWNPWKPVGAAVRMPDGSRAFSIASVPARFIQFRITWNNGSATKVDRVRLFYTPLNIAPKLVEIRVGSSRGGAGPYNDPMIPENVPTRTGDVNISWQVVNSDQDALEYRLWVRKVGEKNWRPLTPRAPVTATNFTWKAAAFADGLYEVKVEASDAPANAPGAEMKSEMVSRPFLVDNSAPRVEKLQIANGTVTFAASDAASRLIGVQIRVDDEPWRNVPPEDGIFDSLRETFRFSLPSTLSRGVHLLQVRVADESFNVFVTSQEFTF